MIVGCTPTQFKETGVNNQFTCIDWPDRNRTWSAVKKNCSSKARACLKSRKNDFSNAELFAIEPKNAEDMYAMCALGHEYYHSVKGRWHE